MGNKYSGLQIGIHWLVFLLVIVTYCAMELRGFSRAAIVPGSIWYTCPAASRF